MITDEELARRLDHAAAPARRMTAPTNAVALLVSDTRRKAESTSLRRKITTGVVAGSVVVGLAASPAAAEAIRQFLAQSDWTSEGTEVIEGSEFVDTSASDLGAYIEWIYPEWLPLAPGQTESGVIEQVRSGLAANPGLQQEVGIRRQLEHAVYVGWIDEWIDADAAGDADRRAAALAILAEAPTWPAFVATDGGGVTYIMAGYAAEIAAGDTDAAQELAQIEGARSWDGVDRANLPGSIFGKYVDEYEATR